MIVSIFFPFCLIDKENQSLLINRIEFLICNHLIFWKVMLATENLSKLSTECGQIRWMFRLHDYNGDGKVPVSVMPKIIKSFLSFNTV